MIRELTDMELDAVCGGGKKRRKKHGSGSVTKSIKQEVDIDLTNVAIAGFAKEIEIEQENEANVFLVAINA